MRILLTGVSCIGKTTTGSILADLLDYRFFDLGEHPRGAGTFSWVLGHYAREEKALTLMDGLRKMTLMPAQRLDSYVPQMKNKGRIKVGADADLTIFDADRVIDRATFEQPMQASEGIVHVLVGGVFVVRDSELVDAVFPGQVIRRPGTGGR